jgi:signal transduction histidine kinase
MMIIIVAFIMSVWMFDSYHSYKTLEKQQYERTEKRNKMALKFTMEQFVNVIDVARKRMGNDSLAKEFILSFAEVLRIPGSGYVFINRTDGKALVFKGKRVDKDSVYINELKDSKGNYLYILEMNSYNKPGGDFIYYYFGKLNDSTEQKKISFITGYKDFKWILGVGNYLGDIKSQTSGFLGFFWKRFLNNAWSIFVFFIAIGILIYIIADRISKRIANEVEAVKEYLSDRLNPDSRRGRSENKISIKEMKLLFDKIDDLIDQKLMLEEKQKEYSAGLEKLVKERTSELQKKAEELEDKNKELERINDVFVDREFRIKELRDELEYLKKLTGQSKN